MCADGSRFFLWLTCYALDTPPLVSSVVCIVCQHEVVDLLAADAPARFRFTFCAGHDESELDANAELGALAEVKQGVSVWVRLVCR